MSNTKPMTTTINTTITTSTNGTNLPRTAEILPMEKSVVNDLSTDTFGRPSTSPSSSSHTLGGFNTLKTDLPGRVSFSKNDVYEIDYSDIDNDTDTSRSYDFMESFRKKNVHFEDEYTKRSKYGVERIGGKISDSENRARPSQPLGELFADITGASSKQSTAATSIPTTSSLSTATTITTTTGDDKHLPSMETMSSNTRTKLELASRLDVLPEGNENGQTVPDNNDSSEKIIEDYKRQIENINRQHEMEMKWNETGASLSDYLPKSGDNKAQIKMLSDANNLLDDPIEYSGSGDSWSTPSNGHDNKPTHSTTKANNISNTSDDSATKDSTSTVINNYLKITNQKTNGSNKPGSAIIKLRTTKKLAANNGGGGGARVRSGQSANQASKNLPGSTRLTKAKSATHLHRIADIKLDEFQIDKVESWMSIHNDTFSDAGLNSYRKQGKFGSTSNLDYKKTWRETPLSKTDDEGNYSLDDPVDNTSIDGSSSGEIELVLKKLEGRRMKISFG